MLWSCSAELNVVSSISDILFPSRKYKEVEQDDDEWNEVQGELKGAGKVRSDKEGGR